MGLVGPAYLPIALTPYAIGSSGSVYIPPIASHATTQSTNSVL